jgi:Spy/CpxP family protein refolding chaperone
MKRIVTAIAIVALLVSAGVVLYSQQGPGNQPGPNVTPGTGRGGTNTGMMGMGMRNTPTAMSALTPPFIIFNPRGQDQLNLTVDQKTKLTAALDAYQKSVSDPKVVEAVEKARKALREALLNKATTNEQLGSLISAARTADKPIMDAQLTLWNSIRTILTAEQLKSLQQMNMTPGGGFGGGNRGNMGPGGGMNRGGMGGGMMNRGQNPGGTPPPPTDEE